MQYATLRCQVIGAGRLIKGPVGGLLQLTVATQCSFTLNRDNDGITIRYLSAC